MILLGVAPCTAMAIEIYARLTDAELAEMPADQEPVFLVADA